MRRRAPETNALIAYFKHVAEAGEVATYEEMGKILVDNYENHRGKITTAIAALQKDHNFVAINISSVGYRFQKNEGVPTVVGRQFDSKVRGVLNRTQKKLDTVDYTKLSPTEREVAYIQAVKISSHNMLIQPAFIEKVSKIVVIPDRYLDVARTASILMRNIS